MSAQEATIRLKADGYEFEESTVHPVAPRSFSPRSAITAPVVQQMNWADACKALLDHKIVKRASWPEPAAIVFMDDDRVKIKNPDGTVHILIVSSGDMLGEDWVVAQPSVQSASTSEAEPQG